MVNVLVTGGSGFIGSHLVGGLIKRGHTVLNFDQRPPVVAEERNLWFSGDILDPPSIRAAVREARPEVVFHLAARAEIFSRSLDAFASIHEGTRNLLAALDDSGSVRLLVNTSTQLVVGPGQEYISDESYAPYTMYGHAKMMAEKILRNSDPAYPWVTVRPTNIWGPGHPSFASSIWTYLAKRYYLHPETEEPVIRCYGYVANTVDQYIGLMNAAPTEIDRRVFYMGDAAIDSSVWLDEFSIALNGKPTRRMPPSLLQVGARIGDALNRIGLRAPLDSGRLMRMTTSYLVPLDPLHELVGAPRISLREGVDATVAWLRQAHPQTFLAECSRDR